MKLAPSKPWKDRVLPENHSVGMIAGGNIAVMDQFRRTHEAVARPKFKLSAMEVPVAKRQRGLVIIASEIDPPDDASRLVQGIKAILHRRALRQNAVGWCRRGPAYEMVARFYGFKASGHPPISVAGKRDKTQCGLLGHSGKTAKNAGKSRQKKRPDEGPTFWLIR